MFVWKSVFASVIGYSHADNQQTCQDACHAQADQHYWIGIVSDGAGSATHGGEAANYVVEHLPAYIHSIAPGDMTLEQLSHCVDQLKQALCYLAEHKGLSPRDYACTLLIAVISQNQAWFAQIGDGAMVVSNGSTQGVVFWPEQGTYANMTHFLTDDTALAHLQLCEVTVSIMEIAMLSDGLQRLALNYSQKTPHHEFFAPMWQQLRRRQHLPLLHQQLEIFLHSASVNDRTDDDKTLVLATRLSVDIESVGVE